MVMGLRLAALQAAGAPLLIRLQVASCLIAPLQLGRKVNGILFSIMKIQKLMDFGFSRNIHKKISLAYAFILKVADLSFAKGKDCCGSTLS